MRGTLSELKTAVLEGVKGFTISELIHIQEIATKQGRGESYVFTVTRSNNYLLIH